ncbi:MAG: peptidoglycan editing factor PgeF [Ignavibacteriales bacterium]|nr:peptidoglycan editing factor PgeF [Ignavibacteriales bacterium]
MFPQIRFALSGRQGGVSGSPYGFNLSYHVGESEENVRRNRGLFFGSLGIQQSRLAYAKQCHSANAVVVHSPGSNESCDAMITNSKNVYLAITVADCVPIFAFDTRKSIVAAIHAGWRGTADGISSTTLHTLETELNSDPHDLVAFVGPSAGSCCFEVGEDVAKRISDQFVVKREGRAFVDLKMANVAQLREAGMNEENIEVSPYCTICNPDRFHSYRRDKERSGRMLGVIGLI